MPEQHSLWWKNQAIAMAAKGFSDMEIASKCRIPLGQLQIASNAGDTFATDLHTAKEKGRKFKRVCW